jgi:hypothetical protein
LATLDVYLRGEQVGDRDFVSSMLASVGIDDWILKDLNLNTDPDPSDNKICIAFGDRCEGYIKPRAAVYFILPVLSKLNKETGDPALRKKTWETLQEVKKILDNPLPNEHTITPANQEQQKWEYVLMKISGKDVCIFEGDKPPSDIQAERFISKEDLKLLLALKEALGAEQVILG